MGLNEEFLGVAAASGDTAAEKWGLRHFILLVPLSIDPRERSHGPASERG